MLSIPQLPRGRARLTWQVEADGAVFYTVDAGGGASARLNPGMLLVALQADGSRNLREIIDALRDAGLQLDDPAVAVLTFRRLEQVGAVEMDWHFETAGPLRHACTGCGRSCEGHLIGPLSPGEVERLARFKDELKALEPDLAEGDPVLLYEEGRRAALNTRSGRCIFLTSANQCAIHKHFGGDQKPLKCQLFPLRVIEAEDGFRIGFSSRCAMAHRSFRSAPAAEPAELLTRFRLRRPPGDIVGLDPMAPRSFRESPRSRRNRAEERALLAILRQPGASLADWVLASAQQPSAATVPSQGFVNRAATLLRRFADRYSCDPLNRPGSVYGDGVRRFLGALLDVPEAPSWTEPPDAARDYLGHALTQFLFLRESAAFGRVRLAYQVAILGVLASLWTSSPPWREFDRVSDEVAASLSYWLRIHNGGRALGDLFDSADEAAELASLLEAAP